MNSRMLRMSAWFLVLAGGGVGLWLTLRPAPVPCDFETVGRGRLLVTADEDGRTRLKDRYVVSAPLAGRCERITLKPGDPVEAGTTVLARITAPEPALLDQRVLAESRARVKTTEAAVSRADVELARAQTELDHIQAEYERVRTAAAQQAANKQELEDELVMLRSAEHARNAVRFSRQMAAYEREQARAALLHATGERAANSGDAAPPFEIVPPINGKVLRIMHESAGVVYAGEPLIELGSPEALEVEVDMLSDQAVKVRPGARVSLERWGGDQPLAGVVRVVEPSGYTKVSALGVEEQRVNVIIDFLDGPEVRGTLGDNFRIEARVEIWDKPDALLVPVGALFRRGDAWVVYVYDAGRARLRPVAIGQRSDRLAEVLTGLSQGERVIVFPGDRVAEGVRVAERTRAR